MQQLVLMLHVLIAAGLVILVLLQQGKGAEMGAAFGSGASQTVFGSQGSGSFMLKLTGVFAALFFVTSLTLGYMASREAKQEVLPGLSKAALKEVIPPTAPSLPTQNPVSNSQNPATTGSAVMPPVTPPDRNN